jgi:uncharacterized protein (DUF1330 family)
MLARVGQLTWTEVSPMAGYIIVDVEVHNQDAYREYTSQVPDTLVPYGGEFIVRGGTADTLEGRWNPQRVVVLKFPSAEQARAWHGSPAYQAILPIRQRNAKTNFLTVVDGV